MKESRYINKSSEELVLAISRDGGFGSQRQEEIKAALFHVLGGKIADSVDRYSATSEKLSNRILWLNIILGAFTIIGTLIAVFSLFTEKL